MYLCLIIHGHAMLFNLIPQMFIQHRFITYEAPSKMAGFINLI